jgi:putative hydrolase of the HAD superfamily
VLAELSKRGLIVGAISNSHRSLDAFCDHFSLRRSITVAVSSAEHGYMKPHRSIFETALAKAGVAPGESVMVGDSIAHDIAGALAAGMRAILLRRSGELPADVPPGLPVITTLRDLPPLLELEEHTGHESI